jgi:hypothetical protein
MKREALKLIAPMLALFAVVSWAAVKTDYDHEANFSQYKTYSWIGVPKASNDLWAERITRDVDGELAAKGWTKVESGGDARVSAFGRTENRQTIETYYNGYGGGWMWRGFGGATTFVDNTPVGTLVVDIFDNQTKKLIWRGWSSDTLSTNVSKNEKKLEKAVEDMFKKFPTPRG